MIDSFVMLFQQFHVEYFLVVDGMLGYVIELMESTGCRLARMEGPGSCAAGDSAKTAGCLRPVEWSWDTQFTDFTDFTEQRAESADKTERVESSWWIGGTELRVSGPSLAAFEQLSSPAAIGKSFPGSTETASFFLLVVSTIILQKLKNSDFSSLCAFQIFQDLVWPSKIVCSACCFLALACALRAFRGARDVLVPGQAAAAKM